jgi:hypothetical protein
MNNAYIIKDTDHFHQDRYPQVVNELAVMNQSIRSLQGRNKSDIVISFLKDHSIKVELMEGNKKLTELITSGFLPMSHIEALFESCRGNKHFQNDLMAFIKKQVD